MKQFLKFIYAFLISFNMMQLEAHMNHQKAPIMEQWQENNLKSFDELMLSWNATRPEEGKFLFYLSVKVDEWTPWLLYASWGSKGQESYDQKAPEAPVKVYQDALEVLEGKKATGFQIKIVTEGKAHLNDIRSLHVYTNGDHVQEAEKMVMNVSPINLAVAGLSQMTLQHVRHEDLCSPTSTAAAVRYLSKNNRVDPVLFAQKVLDGGFDIFGNWVFNVAEASTQLDSSWSCWVERLSGFDKIYEHLKQGAPVVVSVRGPLPGSASPYEEGHLVVVVGYDPEQQKVKCMDPAFPSDNNTHVTYDLSDFVTAWGRRGRVAYVFSKES